MKKILSTAFCFLLSALLFASPLVSLAQQASPSFSRQGIFGCNRNNAALSGSVGAFSATGGVYVPVADFTTELNTGTLVYLECVLRGIVNRQSEAASTGLVQKTIQNANTGGRDGNPKFRSDGQAEDVQAVGPKVYSALVSMKNQNDPLMREAGGTIVPLVARTYLANQHPLDQLACDHQVDLKACRDAEVKSDECINALVDPNCSAIFRTLNSIDYLNSEQARVLKEQQDCLNRGGGFYCDGQLDEDGDWIITTPSSLIQETTAQAITSGFRRIESANNVDQMVGALYAGLAQQVLTSTGGLLKGLTGNIGSQPSYLTQLTSESSAGLQNAAANLALGLLAGARQAEVQYNKAMTSIANTLSGTIGQLRSLERQCWDLIAFNNAPAPALRVCTAAPTGNTCTAVSGGALKIATSTYGYAQGVIDREIAPLANKTIENLQSSQTALTLIDQLIAGVSNTASLNAQRLALVQLDQLVSQGKLHVQADVTAAQQQETAVTEATANLFTQTKTLWADDKNLNAGSGIGWCNFQNQTVIDHWTSKWK
jgi:hypothetical protein